MRSSGGQQMELYIFGRFLVLDGKESAFEEALGEVVTATRAEVGCLEVHGYRGVRNARLYYLHSRWKDVEVFEAHAPREPAETAPYWERASMRLPSSWIPTRFSLFCSSRST